MITLYTGTPGSGKSLYACSKILDIVNGISPYLVALVAAVGLLIGCHLIDALNWWKW